MTELATALYDEDVLSDELPDAALSGVSPNQKHELGKIDFEIIDNAF